MAFVNERLTLEQREEFEELKIINPVPHNQGILSPLHWTIDHDNDMYLIRAGVFKEFPDERYFVFYTGGRFFPLVLNASYKANSVIWSVTKLTPNDSYGGDVRYYFSGDEPFADDLKKALIVYKYDGRPKQPFENLEVSFNF